MTSGPARDNPPRGGPDEEEAAHFKMSGGVELFYTGHWPEFCLL